MTSLCAPFLSEALHLSSGLQAGHVKIRLQSAINRSFSSVSPNDLDISFSRFSLAGNLEDAKNFAMLGAPVIMKITTEKLSLPFDHVAAHEFLTKNDPLLADVITRTGEFQFKLDECDSVYESLLEAIAY